MIKNIQNAAVWCVMFAVIGILYVKFSDKLFVGVGKIVVEQPGTGGKPLIVLWRGKVEPPMGDKLFKAINENGAGTNHIILKLDSRGGSTNYGSRVIAQLNHLKSRYTIDTHVESGDNCLSMCVALYLQGQTRFAAPNARFMFHEVSSHDVISNKPVAMSNRERQIKTDRLYLRHFEEAQGVSSAWVRQLRSEMQGKDVWRSGRQLIDEKSGIVQKLI